MGAALAVLASYVVMAFSLFLVTRRIYPVAYEFGKLARIMAIVIVTGLVYYYLYYRVGLELWHEFALLGGFAAVLFALRVVEERRPAALERIASGRKITRPLFLPHRPEVPLDTSSRIFNA